MSKKQIFYVVRAIKYDYWRRLGGSDHLTEKKFKLRSSAVKFANEFFKNPFYEHILILAYLDGERVHFDPNNLQQQTQEHRSKGEAVHAQV